MRRIAIAAAAALFIASPALADVQIYLNVPGIMGLAIGGDDDYGYPPPPAGAFYGYGGDYPVYQHDYWGPIYRPGHPIQNYPRRYVRHPRRFYDGDRVGHYQHRPLNGTCDRPPLCRR